MTPNASLASAVERLERTTWDSRVLPAPRDVRTVLDLNEDCATELEEARKTISLLRTQIMIELRRGVDRWEGVPGQLETRLDAIDGVLVRLARGEAA